MLKKICVFAAFFFVTFQASAADFFTGQKAAACEVILCLSTGSPPHECKNSLKKYFKIMVKSSLGVLNPKKTLEARKNFLNLCPNVDEKDVDRVNTSQNVPEYSGWVEGTGLLPGYMSYQETYITEAEAWEIYNSLSDSEKLSFARQMVEAGIITSSTDCNLLSGEIKNQCESHHPTKCWGLTGQGFGMCMSDYYNPYN